MSDDTGRGQDRPPAKRVYASRGTSRKVEPEAATRMATQGQRRRRGPQRRTINPEGEGRGPPYAAWWRTLHTRGHIVGQGSSVSYNKHIGGASDLPAAHSRYVRCRHRRRLGRVLSLSVPGRFLSGRHRTLDVACALCPHGIWRWGSARRISCRGFRTDYPGQRSHAAGKAVDHVHFRIGGSACVCWIGVCSRLRHAQASRERV